MAAVDPVLEQITTGREALGLRDGELTHAGPPIEPARMAQPMRRALAGAAVLEGWAADLEHGLGLLDAGELRVGSNHDHGAVAPMAGVISPSMPVAVVSGAVTNLCEGVGRALRFGAWGDDVAARLRWLATDLAPAIEQALPDDGLRLAPLIAGATACGDDLHQRNVAGTALLGLALAGLPAPCDAFLAATPQFFLNLAMASAKAATDAAREVEGAAVVVAIARNGVDVGIQVAGTGRRWFTAPAPIPVGHYVEGYSVADACPDLGDSAIVETYGLGGYLAATSPQVLAYLEAPPDTASEARRRATVAVATHPIVPGAPLALDARAIVDHDLAPRIFTGIAHRDGVPGQIGAGITEAPLAAFRDAVAQLP